MCNTLTTLQELEKKLESAKEKIQKTISILLINEIADRDIITKLMTRNLSINTIEQNKKDIIEEYPQLQEMFDLAENHITELKQNTQKKSTFTHDAILLQGISDAITNYIEEKKQLIEEIINYMINKENGKIDINNKQEETIKQKIYNLRKNRKLGLSFEIKDTILDLSHMIDEKSLEKTIRILKKFSNKEGLMIFKFVNTHRDLFFNDQNLDQTEPNT